jgi:nucleotide-binding universal stress UspA family protein
MTKLERVLVATDFSEPSQAALSYGRELARAFGAKLTLLHVVESVATLVAGFEGYAVDVVTLQNEANDAADRQLNATITKEDRQTLDATTARVISNVPAQAIATYARDHGIGLIVLGTHGRGGMSHMLLGSVAEKVVRLAPCPVLTVRHPEREFIVPEPVHTSATAV